MSTATSSGSPARERRGSGFSRDRSVAVASEGLSRLKPLPRRTRRPVAAIAAMLALSACAEKASPLPALTIDADRVTVSGLSSGAIMAQQVHLAFSRTIDGAGLVAGPPYGCAEGKLDVALARCLVPRDAGPDAAALADVVRARAAAGALDPVDGLAGDKVWVFHGTGDTLVAEPVARASAALYDALASDATVATDFARPTGHVFPTDARGGDCATTAPPFIGACGFDAAGEIFRTVVGATAEPAAAASGELVAFDQRPFAAGGADPHLADTGYLYVPGRCRESSCALHIAFHGCEQNADKIGTAFAGQAGYNRWADAAGVVVLYPQTSASMLPLNPKACWDWWGYTGPDYDTRNGAQLRWLANALAAMGVRV
jgi:poly(3-hydroxybutyrate) depolymerase